MRSSFRALGVVLLGTLALSGCSFAIPETSEKPAPGKGAEPAPTIDAEPAAGEQMTGDGYSYRTPEGWGPFEYPGTPKPDSFIIDLDDADDFSDNFNVIVSPAGRLSADVIEKQGRAEFESQADAEVKVGERVTIAGAESAHFTVTMSSQGVSYVIEQYYPTSDEQTYVATFSFSPDVPQAERLKVAESTLASWEWK